MSEAARDEIIPLWPTWVGQLQLPGAEDANREFLELAKSSGITGNLFDAGHHAAGWLRQWVETCVAQWFEHQKLPAVRCRVVGRLEALGFGQYRELHNEPGA